MSRRRRRIEPFDLKITELEPNSCGRGEHEGQPVLVRGAPPGAVVHVRPFKKKRGTIHGRRVRLVEPPPDHVEPRCAVFGLCGGCALQELSLTAQRAAKERMVRRILAPLEGVEVHPVIGAPAAYGYRNKVELSFGVRRYLSEEDHAAGEPIEGSFLGFHAPGRFDRVVDAERCELVPEGLNDIIHALRVMLESSELPPWDARAHTGFWKHAVLRETTLGERLVAIYTNEGDALPDLMTLRLDATLSWYVNAGVADAAIGELRSVISGDGTITEQLGEVRYQLSATSFFQTNTPAAARLYDVIAEAAGSGPRLWDLYCGTGAIGLYLAPRFDEVVGVELDPGAVEDARANAARNGRTVEYHCGRVEDVLPRLRGDDIVVVDPPRAGLHPKAAKWLAAAPVSSLVYIACKPGSLARDRELLEAGGWVMVALWIVDLFPQTGHVEAVARFLRPGVAES
ncbi:MAG TPA: 23S rRNA (uracil(1939)-C(5))-methyltransferase RlmD [Myxococcota bacterium]|nr:23S rRNA (uracil(1939)-C(5))-methyltransferase RlmD [Myxococcota bacterium]